MNLFKRLFNLFSNKNKYNQNKLHLEIHFYTKEEGTVLLKSNISNQFY